MQDNSISINPLQDTDYSSCVVRFIDKFDVRWDFGFDVIPQYKHNIQKLNSNLIRNQNFVGLTIDGFKFYK